MVLLECTVLVQLKHIPDVNITSNGTNIRRLNKFKYHSSLMWRNVKCIPANKGKQLYFAYVDDSASNLRYKNVVTSESIINNVRIITSGDSAS